MVHLFSPGGSGEVASFGLGGFRYENRSASIFVISDDRSTDFLCTGKFRLSKYLSVNALMAVIWSVKSAVTFSLSNKLQNLARISGLHKKSRICGLVKVTYIL